MPSFDTVIEPDWVELKNVASQVSKEIATRFDFKGSQASCAFEEKSSNERELVLTADSDFQLEQLREVLLAKMARRGVDLRFVDLTAKPVKLGGDRLKLTVPVQCGIPSESAKKIQQAIKASKLKVQAAIQGDAVRISGAKRDDLQAAIALLRKEMHELPLAFNNFRD